MPWFFIQLRYMKPFLSCEPNHSAERRATFFFVSDMPFSWLCHAGSKVVGPGSDVGILKNPAMPFQSIFNASRYRKRYRHVPMKTPCGRVVAGRGRYLGSAPPGQTPGSCDDYSAEKRYTVCVRYT